MGKKTLLALLFLVLTVPVFSDESAAPILVTDLSYSENISYLGLQHLVWKEYDMAIAYAAEGIDRFSEDREPFYYIRATAYEAQGLFDSALNDYQRYVELLKTRFSSMLGRGKEEESMKVLLEVVQGYYHLFLLSRVTDSKNPGALIPEYKQFLKERIREATARNFTSLAERMTRLDLYLSDVSEKFDEADGELLRVYIQGDAIRQLNEKERALLKENEQTAIVHLMRIAVAARSLHARQKPYPEFLADYFQDKTLASVLDERLFARARPPRLNGYIFEYKGSPDSFTCSARPVIPNKTGTRSFVVNEDGVIVEDKNNDGISDPGEPIVLDIMKQ